MVHNVLDKTLKGIRGVRLDNRKVLRAPGPRNEYFERIFFVVQQTTLLLNYVD